MIVADFRAAFPEFAVALYSDATVIFWSTLAEKQISADSWGNLYTNGVFLLTAHMLKLSTLSASGGGLVALRKVGDVSVTYDLTLGYIANAGLYNRTIYGQQYYTLMNMVGIGAYQL